MVFEKTKKSGLKSKKGFFLNVVMFIVLTFVQYSFTYAAKVPNAEFSATVSSSGFNKEMLPLSRYEEVKPELPATIEILNLVIEKTNVNDNIDILNSETDKDNKISIAVIQIPTEQTDNEVVVVAEVMPAFPGGELAMRRFIAKSIKYPNLAAEQGIQGRVFVKFVVNKEGVVYDAKIARGVNPLLDNEAIRVIMSLPKWSPGMTQGKAVNVSLMFPISFQLQ